MVRTYRGIPISWSFDTTYDGGFDALCGCFVATEPYIVQALSATLQRLSSGYLELVLTLDGVNILRSPWRVTQEQVPAYAALPSRFGLPVGSVLAIIGDGASGSAVDSTGLNIQLVLKR